jgi:hypothetical protein
LNPLKHGTEKGNTVDLNLKKKTLLSEALKDRQIVTDFVQVERFYIFFFKNHFGVDLISAVSNVFIQKLLFK